MARRERSWSQGRSRDEAGHPDLLPPFARLIARAAERTQVWVVTHSTILADAPAQTANAKPRQVIKRNGETLIEGLTLAGTFRDAE